jgi:hypothetical protein
MTRSQGRWLMAGGIALVAWAGLGWLGRAPGAGSWPRLANAACLLLATGLAVASTLLASRDSRSTERIFWALLSSAAATGGLCQSLAAAGLFGGAFWRLPLALAAGTYLPTALAMAALLMRPHRSQGVPSPVAALDGLIVATCAAFLISYGLLVPRPPAARLVQAAVDALPLVQALLLALTVRDASYRRVYRLLAGGFALRAALGGMMPEASWAPVLVFLAVAGLEPSESVWIATTRSERAGASLGRLAATLVALPPVIDGIARALGAGVEGAGGRSRLAMAATVVLALLAAARVRLSAAAVRAAEAASAVPGDEESGRFLGFAAGVAHQVNNRLNIVAGWSQVALRRGQGHEADLRALLSAVREASDAAAQFQRLAAASHDGEEA